MSSSIYQQFLFLKSIFVEMNLRQSPSLAITSNCARRNYRAEQELDQAFGQLLNEAAAINLTEQRFKAKQLLTTLSHGASLSGSGGGPAGAGDATAKTGSYGHVTLAGEDMVKVTQLLTTQTQMLEELQAGQRAQLDTLQQYETALRRAG